MKLWQIAVAVVAGVLFGTLEPDKLTNAFGYATLYFFLPALLFEAAWNLNYRAIARNRVAIAALAGPGVLITALIVAGALALVGIPFGPAFLTGTILSATDPIAVVAVFRRLRVPRTLSTIVECESLFNDAVAVVLYRGVLAALAFGVASSSQTSLSAVAAITLGGALGGVAFGVALGFIVARALRNNANVAKQIVATVFCAYAVYFAADYLQFSGIFAVVACGIALRHFERRWITLTIADEVLRFWDVAAIAANALVFFLVGAALQIGHVAREPAFVVACLVAIAVSRVVLAATLLPKTYPREWIGVVRVAGMRGALSLALAVALPASTPYREAIVDATFAVALATILASALAADRVVRSVARSAEPSS